MASVTVPLQDGTGKALKFQKNDDDTLTVIFTEVGRNPVIWATYNVLPGGGWEAVISQFFATNYPPE